MGKNEETKFKSSFIYWYYSIVEKEKSERTIDQCKSLAQ